MPREVDYLLIGGGMACFHAAKQMRRVGAQGSILIAGEEPLPPYDRPPLSKELLRGEKTTVDIVYESPEKLAEQGIDLLTACRVERLDAEGRRAFLADGDSIRFGKALIATGGRPVRLDLPGGDLPGVFYLRTAADAEAIAAAARMARSAVVVGGGFIGLEVAASLTQRGLQVTVVEALPHIWARFADARLAGFFQDYCSARGVRFLTGETITEIRGSDRPSAVVTRSGATLDCQLVCIGVGIRPNVELAQEAGLAVENGIVVDEFMRSSHPDIYAAGDVCNFPDPIAGKRRRVEHWGHAEYSGQIAGRNMSGDSAPYDFLSYVWSDIFDLRLEAAGDESERDQVVLRGSFADGRFSYLYLKQGVMTAYFSVNSNVREFSVFRRLIRARKDLRGSEAVLADPNADLRSLL